MTRLRIALLAVAAAALWCIGLGGPGFLDYEGRYAAVAREMLARGDWITPRLDGTLFLNKPPLLYWLTAMAFAVGGPSEWARLISVTAGAVALVSTCSLGTALYDEATGLVAGAVLATMVGFVLEVRQLRPDTVVIAAVVGAILCWHRAATAGDARSRGRWLMGMYAALGIGFMAKGAVAAVVAAIPIGITTLREHDIRRGIASLAPVRGLVVLGLVVIPWHAAVSWRHEGFAWDYVVNQHLLFFLDKKLPRDSEGIPLATFLGAFAARTLPWGILVFATAREAWRGTTATDPTARATLVVWTWLVGVLILFGAAPSRLEHYALPALPAVALLAARGWRLLADGDASRPAWRVLAATGLAMLAVAGALLAYTPGALARVRFTAEMPGLTALLPWAAAVFAAMGLGLGAAATARAPRALGVTLGASGIALAAIVVVALGMAEPMLSWRPVARVIEAHAAGATVVLEAPEEYQLVGGLAYYLDRRVLLLEPPGFVPPTYLAGKTGDVFVSRPEFERRWQSPERLVLVSNPQRWRDDPAGLAPVPWHPIGRAGRRWVLVNAPSPE